jgi:hypothetical protein
VPRSVPPSRRLSHDTKPFNSLHQNPLQLLQELTRRQREEIHLFLNERFYESSDWDWETVPAELTLEDLYCCAVAVLGDPATALDWLTSPNPELNMNHRFWPPIDRPLSRSSDASRMGLL